MSETFQAVVATETDGKVKGRLTEIALADLPDHDVLVDVAFSTLNYKDALAVTGKGRICRSTPMVCGIDLAGTVLEDRSGRFAPGTRVLVNGWGLSETEWGGYAAKARMKPEWLTEIPAAFSFQDAMAIGTAGYTAMLCVHAIQDHGGEPGDGPVLVTGASGGVGTVAIMLLKAFGYEVVASSGRAEENEAFLKELGASAVQPREELSREAKPLEKEKWAAVVDAVGAETLATAIAQTRREGIVTACGLAGGMGLPTSVAPFILRGVTLRGIDSVYAVPERRYRAWEDLARLADRAQLVALSRTEALSDVEALAVELLAGRVRGRIILDVSR